MPREESPDPCKLCLEEIQPGKKFYLQTCGCFFCLECMTTYVKLLVDDGVALNISCPDAECVVQGRLQIDEVSSLIYGATLERYLQLRQEQEVAVNPLRAFCPTPDCSNICVVPEAKSHSMVKKMKNLGKKLPAIPLKVYCPKCTSTFCHICKANWADKHKCQEQEFLTGNNEILSKTRARMASNRTDAVIKRCPVCSILIEKDRGCGQMICKNCNHVFCWHCLKLLDNDFMLRHYDKGPCKNYLGHTRSQVFRHRLGVIGLFAAFCILLLTIAPILLLAAPIFLCCKWKDCCERAWHRAQFENNNALFAELQTAQTQRSTVETVSEVMRQESQTSTAILLPNQVPDEHSTVIFIESNPTTSSTTTV